MTCILVIALQIIFILPSSSEFTYIERIYNAHKKVAIQVYELHRKSFLYL